VEAALVRSAIHRFGDHREEVSGRKLSRSANAGASEERSMRSVLLWLLGVPLSVIILIALFTHHA